MERQANAITERRTDKPGKKGQSDIRTEGQKDGKKREIQTRPKICFERIESAI